MANWNWLDWVLAGIVLASILTAVVKGFAAELISLAAVAAGVIVAASNYHRAAPWFEDVTRSHEIALGLGFLSLFLGTLVAGALVSVLAAKLIQKAELQLFDRFLGGVFGLIRGLLIDCVLILTLMAFTIKTRAVQESALAPYVTAGSRAIAIVMPKEVKNDFWMGFEKFRQALSQTDKRAMEKQPMTH